MRMINTFFAVFFTLSLVSASPLGRLSNEKRQNDDNVVWVTVTSTSTVTIHTHTGKAPRATKTVTIHATFGEPPQRAQFINTPTVETPVANTPNAPVVAAAPVAASPTPVVPVTTPTAPAAAVVKGSTSNTGSTGTSFTGQGTFYSAGLGSCGVTSADSDYICAISRELYDSLPNGGNPNNSPFCGRRLKASLGGKTVTVKVVDRCEGCAVHDVDFSPSAFAQIASESQGRYHYHYKFNTNG